MTFHQQFSQLNYINGQFSRGLGSVNVLSETTSSSCQF